jgi:hypothetical protein
MSLVAGSGSNLQGAWLAGANLQSAQRPLSG